ncbi:hypothetical protein GGF37_002013 [Kickxella alabastrina]|nr:hypothetical protein GGF37_002013 [Kickxella alabastrina]
MVVKEYMKLQKSRSVAPIARYVPRLHSKAARMAKKHETAQQLRVSKNDNMETEREKGEGQFGAERNHSSTANDSAETGQIAQDQLDKLDSEVTPEKIEKFNKKFHTAKVQMHTVVRKALALEKLRVSTRIKRAQLEREDPKLLEIDQSLPAKKQQELLKKQQKLLSVEEAEALLEKIKAMDTAHLANIMYYKLAKRSSIIRDQTMESVATPEVVAALNDSYINHFFSMQSILNTLKYHILELESVLTIDKRSKEDKVILAEKLAEKRSRKAAAKEAARIAANAKERRVENGISDSEVDPVIVPAARHVVKFNAKPSHKSGSGSGYGSGSGSDFASESGNENEGGDDHGYESVSDLDAELAKKHQKPTKRNDDSIKSTFVGSLDDFVSDDNISDSDSDDEVAEPKRKRKEEPKAKSSKKYKGGKDAYDEVADKDFKNIYGTADAERKNRPGQRARRQKFEKMYGKDANHVKLMEKDKKEKPRQPAPQFQKKPDNKPIAPAAKSEAMHPSWEAKIRQKKIMEQAKSIQGTKIVFD